MQFFFEGLPINDGPVVAGMVEPNEEALLLEFLNTRDGLDLNLAFVKVTDAEVRESLITLVRSLAKH